MKTGTDGHAGYANRALALGYAYAGLLYDVLVWWGFLPLGGERRCRRRIVGWLGLAPGQRVLSLCCGTGSMERALLQEEPRLAVVGLDLGRGQLARARVKLRGSGVLHLRGDAAQAPLRSGSFDRVLIGMALHEMTRPTRLAVLREARRLCAPGGRVLAVEHGRPAGRTARVLRSLWWFLWLPGNPEAATVRDLLAHGLDVELRASGLEPTRRHALRADWIEGFLAAPASAGPG